MKSKTISERKKMNIPEALNFPTVQEKKNRRRWGRPSCFKKLYAGIGSFLETQNSCRSPTGFDERGFFTEDGTVSFSWICEYSTSLSISALAAACFAFLLLDPFPFAIEKTKKKCWTKINQTFHEKSTQNSKIELKKPTPECKLKKQKSKSQNKLKKQTEIFPNGNLKLVVRFMDITLNSNELICRHAPLFHAKFLQQRNGILRWHELNCSSSLKTNEKKQT